MITEEDMLGYLQNLLTFELKAESAYLELAHQVNDVELKAELEQLAGYEREHVTGILEMQKIIRK